MSREETCKKKYGEDHYRNIGRIGGAVKNKNKGFANEAVRKKAIANRNHREFDGAIVITEKRIKAINAISDRNLGKITTIEHLADLVEKETGKPLEAKHLRDLIKKYRQHLKIAAPERNIVYFGELEAVEAQDE